MVRVEQLVGEEMCPRYQRAVEILGKRWTGLIIRVLLPGPRRFSEITGTIGGRERRPRAPTPPPPPSRPPPPPPAGCPARSPRYPPRGDRALALSGLQHQPI